MIGFENAGKPYSLPPPSYEEAVYGKQDDGSQNPTSITAETSTASSGYHQPQPSAPGHNNGTPVSHDNIQLQSQQASPLPYAYNIVQDDSCPTGAEVLRDLDEILVYPHSRWPPVHKIRNADKVTILHAKNGSDECCDDCCDCSCTVKLTLSSLDDRKLYYANCMTDNVNCCSQNEQHMDVYSLPGEVKVGSVYIKSLTKSEIMNQSGDVLFNVIKPDTWFSNDPYEILNVRGTKVGTVDSRRGIKNRLTVPKDMPIKHKILILFFTIHRQYLDDVRRNSS